MIDSIFDTQPILEGRFIRTRPLRKTDYRDLFRVASDPMIWEQHPAKTRYQRAEYDQFFEESLESGGALIVTCNNDVVGATRYHNYDKASSEVEIGWTFLARKYWGGIYNKELKHMMLDHAFQYVETVVFLIDRYNLRSQRSVEKIGANVKGTRSKENGLVLLCFQITRNNWEQRPPTTKLKC